MPLACCYFRSGCGPSILAAVLIAIIPVIASST
jgi:hypothetical protein